MNPYEVLGIPEGSDQETIKNAYRELAKKYHPDRYADNPLKELAEEKLKEINKAYDMLTGKAGGNNSARQQNTYSGGNGSFAQIRVMIQTGRVTEADAMLDGMSSRTAEWFYLKGLVALHRGWYDRALSFINTACSMEPNNMEYRSTLNNLRNRTASYTMYGNNQGYNNDCGGDCCTKLCIADCCCEMMGGDLISCC